MRKQSNGKIRRAQSEWETIVEQFEGSGLSAAAFCRREKLSKYTFSKWKGRIEASSAGGAGFVEVRPEAMAVGDAASHGVLEIELPGGITLRWRA